MMFLLEIRSTDRPPRHLALRHVGHARRTSSCRTLRRFRKLRMNRWRRHCNAQSHGYFCLPRKSIRNYRPRPARQSRVILVPLESAPLCHPVRMSVCTMMWCVVKGIRAPNMSRRCRRCLRSAGWKRSFQSALFLDERVLSSCVKIGEGSYAEVFRCTTWTPRTQSNQASSGNYTNTNNEDSDKTTNPCVVFKVVPFGSDTLYNGSEQPTADAVIPEIANSRLLSDRRELLASGEGQASAASKPSSSRGARARKGAKKVVAPPKNSAASSFIRLMDVVVCEGAFPLKLMDEWDAWDSRKGSENDRPDIFDSNQHFVIFVFADGGVDLESVALGSFQEAKAVLLQVAFTLAAAEEDLSFEHRDLHWGNVLVKPCPASSVASPDDTALCYTIDGRRYSLGNVDVADVRASIIDFTLSRLLSPDQRLIYYDFSQDESIFEGEGDYQFEIYRMMRDAIGNAGWASFCPITNVF
eukprot:Opistho-2@64298